MAGNVPETVLKKRKRDEEWANKKTAAAAEAQKKSRSSRRDILKRAESYVNEYRQQVRSIQSAAECLAFLHCSKRVLGLEHCSSQL